MTRPLCPQCGQTFGTQGPADGYCELCVPLQSFALDLARVHELVVVFENSRTLDKQRRGAMGIRSILLTEKSGQSVKQLLGDSEPLVDNLGRQAFDWFQRHRHSETGMVLDRRDFTKPQMASIASVGYHLTLLAEWTRLGYVSRAV